MGLRSEVSQHGGFQRLGTSSWRVHIVRTTAFWARKTGFLVLETFPSEVELKHTELKHADRLGSSSSKDVLRQALPFWVAFLG